MSLSPQFLDELRARTQLSGLIGQSMKLTRAGREFKGCCPFHNEKTPSFYVNDEKGFYHCFGCSAHGDAIRWLTEHQGLPFMDAVKDLAAAAGMEMPARDAQQAALDNERTGMHDIMERAAKWFASNLASDAGAAARAYLDKRGIPAEQVKAFEFGYALDVRKGSPPLIPAAISGVSIDVLVDLGLMRRVNDAEPYDYFRNRLIIPIRDQRGRCIGFGGRIIGQGEPKYLNTPETPLFDKGRTLFNLHRASSEARRTNRLVIVEGYMDVEAMCRAGVAETVAPNGTALTEAQMLLAWRLVPTPICCFDGDKAGRAAAVKAAIRALPGLRPDRSLAFAFPPKDQDPGDVLDTGGAVAVRVMLERPRSLAALLFDHEISLSDMETPEARAGFERRVFAHCEAIEDAAVRAQYITEFRRRLSAMEASWSSPRRAGSKPPEQPSTAAKAIATGGMQTSVIAAVLAGLLRIPEAINECAEALVMTRINDDELAQLRRVIVDLAYSWEGEFDGRFEAALDRLGVLHIADAVRTQKHLPYAFLRGNGPTAAAALKSTIESLAA
jgi:DNA primase